MRVSTAALALYTLASSPLVSAGPHDSNSRNVQRRRHHARHFSSAEPIAPTKRRLVRRNCQDSTPTTPSSAANSTSVNTSGNSTIGTNLVAPVSSTQCELGTWKCVGMELQRESNAIPNLPHYMISVLNDQRARSFTRRS